MRGLKAAVLLFGVLLVLSGVRSGAARAQAKSAKKNAASTRITLRDAEHEAFLAAHPCDPKTGLILPPLPAALPARRKITLLLSGPPVAALEIRAKSSLLRLGEKPKALKPFSQRVAVGPGRLQIFDLTLPVPDATENVTIEYVFTARRSGIALGKLTEVFVLVAGGKNGTQAEFAGRDDKTRGDWLGVYGKEAFMVDIVGGRSVFQIPGVYLQRGLPPDKNPQRYSVFDTRAEDDTLSVRFAAGDSLDDPRLPQRGPGQANKRPPVAFIAERGPLVFAAETNDGRPHVLSLYLLDFARRGQTMQIDVYDLQRHHLDSRQIDNFGEGTYARYRFTGKIALFLTSLTPGAFPTVHALFADAP